MMPLEVIQRIFSVLPPTFVATNSAKLTDLLLRLGENA
jgi:hypothetical protein